MILGGGPNRIGQGIEFDYCCVHAAIALKELGFETIIVNCNPETVSTDYDTSDKLYFEPLTSGRCIKHLSQGETAGSYRTVWWPDTAEPGSRPEEIWCQHSGYNSGNHRHGRGS